MNILRAYIYITARIILFIIVLTTYYLLLDTYYIVIIPLSIIISLLAVNHLNGRSVFYSYTFGLAIIFLISLTTRILYGLSFYRLEYIYIYTTLIPLIITVTPLEIIVFARSLFKPLIYVLIVSRLLTVYISRFWRGLEVYRGMYGRGERWRVLSSVLKSFFSSQPYMVSNIMEYLYVLNLSLGGVND